jgi:transposase-like protein
MEIEKAAAEFRAAVRRAGPRGAGRRYPPAVRQLAVEYFRRRRAAGATLASISRELGVKRHTLVGWTAAPEVAAEAPRFVPVHVVADAPVELGIVVHGPGGLRVEGLDLAGVAELLRRLA